MAYRVSLAAPAETDAYAAFERIREAAPRHAEKWLTRLFEAILSLDEFPVRCLVIAEAKELGYPARHLLYGKGKGVYRIIFHIREEEQHVRILRIWHASVMPSPQRILKLNDCLDLPPKMRQTVKSQNSANGEFDSWECLEESSQRK
jgi:plasmid stabilization system protein ParE